VKLSNKTVKILEQNSYITRFHLVVTVSR